MLQQPVQKLHRACSYSYRRLQPFLPMVIVAMPHQHPLALSQDSIRVVWRRNAISRWRVVTVHHMANLSCVAAQLLQRPLYGVAACG